jgi:GNAT superfamily N-acetyltransferase
MDNETLLALFDTEQRINIEFPGVRKEQRPHVIRFVSESKGPHFILNSQLDGADVEAVIAEEKAYFGPLGEVEWKVYGHDHPADLREQLVAGGFEAEEPDAILVLDLEEASRKEAASRSEVAIPGNDAYALPEMPQSGTDQGFTRWAGDVKVQRLESTSQLEDVRRIEETVWEDDFEWITKNLASDLEVPGYLSVYAAYVDEQPACAGWVYFHPNSHFAGLWGGSTVPEHRGRGLYTAVLEARVQEAAARGYRFLTIDASPMSRPIVTLYGFRLLTMAWACKWGKEQ